MMGGQPQAHHVTAAQFSARFQSKREIYNFLQLDVQAYLPDYDTITTYFMRDMISGKSKCRLAAAPFFDLFSL